MKTFYLADIILSLLFFLIIVVLTLDANILACNHPLLPRHGWKFSLFD